MELLLCIRELRRIHLVPEYALYPYTGRPLTKFYVNLEKLLDKVIIVRVVTNNENVASVKLSCVAEMIKYCKLRNIHLDHSRTIITIFMRMLTAEDRGRRSQRFYRRFHESWRDRLRDTPR